MKTILIVLTDHFSVRNFLHSPFVKNDFDKYKIKVIFVVPDFNIRLSTPPNIKIIPLQSKYNYLNKVKQKIDNISYQIVQYRFSRLNNFYHLTYKKNLPHLYQNNYSFLATFLSRSNLLYSLFYKTYNNVFLGEKLIEKLLSKYKPDLLITTNPQIPLSKNFYLKSRKYGIANWVYINSWDFLTTDGPIISHIDNFIIWNKQMEIELKQYHKINKPIHNIGPLQFDVTFEPNYLLDKKSLYTALNIPPNKKIITYGVCGKKMGPHEPEIAAFLAKNISPQYHLILRGHPEDPSIPKRFAEVIKLPNISLSQGQKFNHIQKYDDQQILYSILKQSEIVICGPTTLTIDAIRFDKPTINIKFDGSLPKEKSAQISLGFNKEHYKELIKHGGIYLAKNFDDLKKHINDALKNPQKLATERKKTREYYLEPLDGKASVRLFNLILNKLYGKKN